MRNISPVSEDPRVLAPADKTGAAGGKKKADSDEKKDDEKVGDVTGKDGKDDSDVTFSGYEKVDDIFRTKDGAFVKAELS